MNYTKQMRTILNRTKSGVLVPTGSLKDSIGYECAGLLSIKAQAEMIERLYTDTGVPLPKSSGLALLMDKTKDLVDRWMLNKESGIAPITRLKVTHFGRIADSVLALQAVPDRKHYLTRLTSGTVDNITPGNSVAKSVLWELELWLSMLKRGVTARLQDPPDIIISVDGHEIAVACKKLFSEKHVQHVLSEAVEQIRHVSAYGIVAVNIDELVPVNRVYLGETSAQATEQLNNINMAFLAKHKRHFRKYLAAERIVGALVSSGCVADLCKEKTQLNFERMHTIWCFPDLSEKQQQCLSSLQKALIK